MTRCRDPGNWHRSRRVSIEHVPSELASITVGRSRSQGLYRWVIGQSADNSLCHDPDLVGLAFGLAIGHFTTCLGDDSSKDRNEDPVGTIVPEPEQCNVLVNPPATTSSAPRPEAGRAVHIYEHPGNIPPLPGALEISACPGAEYVEGAAFGGAGAIHGCTDMLGMSAFVLVPECQEDIRFPAEMVVQASSARVCLLDDVRDAYGEISLLDEDVPCGVQQHLAGLVSSTPLPRAACVDSHAGRPSWIWQSDLGEVARRPHCKAYLEFYSKTVSEVIKAAKMTVTLGTVG